MQLNGPGRMILLHHCGKTYDRKSDPRGRPRRFSLEYIVDRIVYVLQSGCPWRMLPVENGSYKTIFAWFNKFCKRNTFENTFHDIQKWYRKVNREKYAQVSFVFDPGARECARAFVSESASATVLIATDSVCSAVQSPSRPLPCL